MQHSRVHACMWLRANALARMSERCARSRRSIMMAVCSWSCVRVRVNVRARVRVRVVCSRSCVLRGGEIGDLWAGTGALEWAPEP